MRDIRVKTGMDASNFNRITRKLARGITRRGVLALAGALAASKGGNVLALQLGPPTCGQAGAVCTMVSGCCEGFTCVTSSINVNYGVCAPGGSGGTVAATTSLISPFSDGVVEEVSSATANQESTTTTDPQAEREAALAERKARKQAHKSRVKARKDDHRDRRREDQKDQRARRRQRRGPKLELRLFNPGGVGGVETVRVTNRDDMTAVATRIESRLARSDIATDVPENIQLTMQPGEFTQFLATDGDSEPGKIYWGEGAPVCSDSAGDDGFIVYASFSSELSNKEFEILCSESTVEYGSGSGGKNKNRKRKQGQKRRKRNRRNKK